MHCPPLYPSSGVVVISPTYVPIFIYNHLADLSKQMLAVIMTLSVALLTSNLGWMRGQTGNVSSTIITTSHATVVSSHSSNLPADTTYHIRWHMIM